MNQEKRNNIVRKAMELAKNILGNDFSHGFPHVLRVYRIAYSIVDNEKLDIDNFILDTSIYLHDIGRVVGEPHAYYSKLLAQAFLEEEGVDEISKRLIINAIEYHSFSYSKKNMVKPLSIEAKVLSDADKLDALGIVGFIRVFHYGWIHRRTLEYNIDHFYKKIFKLKDLMHFEYSRRKAIELEKKTRRALEELLEELNYTK